MSSLIEKKCYASEIDPVDEVFKRYCSACVEKKCADCIYYYSVILRDREEVMIRTGQVWLI